MTVPQESPNRGCPWKLSNNNHGIRQDMQAMCKFFRETLLCAWIHDTYGSGVNSSADIMGENGNACQVFILVFSRDQQKISHVE